MTKTYEIKRATKVCREIYAGKDSRKAWGKWQREFEGTEMYEEFVGCGRNYNMDWKDFVQEYGY